jgi:hypothetical protein
VNYPFISQICQAKSKQKRIFKCTKEKMGCLKRIKHELEGFLPEMIVVSRHENCFATKRAKCAAAQAANPKVNPQLSQANYPQAQQHVFALKSLLKK